MKQKRFILFVIVVLGLFMSASCSRNKTDKAADSTGPGKDQADQNAVARVGDTPILIDDLEQYISDRQLNMGRAGIEKSVNICLDEMIISHVLAREAMRLKLDQDPRIMQMVRQALNQKLIEEMVNKPVREREITEDELKKYYDAHLNEYARPEQVRLADIFIAVPEKASLEEKNKKLEIAETVLLKVKDSLHDRFGFRTLVRKYSDKHPLYRLGDTGFFDAGGMPTGLDKKLVTAGFNLKKNRTVADKVVETDAGFHIIMRVGKRAAMERKFKDVVSSIEGRIRREEVISERKKYIAMLKDKPDVIVNEQVLENVIKQMTEQNQIVQASSKKKVKRKVGTDSKPSSVPPGLPQKN